MREIIEKYCEKGHAYYTLEGESIECPVCEEEDDYIIGVDVGKGKDKSIINGKCEEQE